MAWQTPVIEIPEDGGGGGGGVAVNTALAWQYVQVGGGGGEETVAHTTFSPNRILGVLTEEH